MSDRHTHATMTIGASRVGSSKKLAPVSLSQDALLPVADLPPHPLNQEVRRIRAEVNP
jgi:hypothetical protein